MERTRLLHDLFMEKALTYPRVSGHQRPLEKDPLAESFSSVNTAATRSLEHARLTIANAMRTMISPNSGATTDVEGALMVVDAELASASASTKAFYELMQKAKRDLERSRERMTGRAADADTQDLGGHDLELISHYLSAASLLSSAVDSRRLDLTICREELEEYKKDLSAPVSLWLCIDASEGRSPQRARRGDGLTLNTKHPLSSVGTLSSSNLLSGVADELLSAHLKTAAATTDKVATALSNTVLGLARRTTRLATADPSVGTAGVKGHGEGFDKAQRGSKSVASPTFVYSEEERQALEHQRDQMLLEERLSDTASAKDIEATINELAQLTSMMQTRVMEQDEQLEGLEKTTTEATSNITKGTEELKKPLKSFWSSTMQMAALLWTLTAFILSLHFVVG